MCNKTNGPRRSKRKPKPRNFTLKHSRKTRTKTRKPKYLSLVRLEENSPQTQTSLINENKDKEITDKQLNLFPLHPENLVEDRDAQYDNVSLLFNTTEEDNDHAVTLNGLLDSEGSVNYKNETATTTTATSEESPLSPSLSTYGYYSTCEDHHTRLLLVRMAMKGKKEGDESEEKWVVYSEVVEEVSSVCGGGVWCSSSSVGGGGVWCSSVGGGGVWCSSSSVGGGGVWCSSSSSVGGGGVWCSSSSSVGGGGVWCSSSGSGNSKKMKKLLALKLDYEEIMNAWSDKGPLYIQGDSPQTVPHLHEPNVLVDGLGSDSNVWKVPELGNNLKIKDEIMEKRNGSKGGIEKQVC